MSAKRAVPHRSQPYDLLLFEWQKTNKANQQKAEAAKQAQPGGPAAASAAGGAGAGGASGGGGGAAATAGTARSAAAAAAATAAAAAAASAAQSDASTPLAAPPLTAESSASGPPVADPPPKAKRRRSSNTEALSGAPPGLSSGGFKLPGDKKGKKGIVYVGEWEESDDDGADELVDSDEEVEAVLRGLARAEHGRPLFISRGGGAGFAAPSLFTGRNHKLGKLRGTLRDVFRPAA